MFIRCTIIGRKWNSGNSEAAEWRRIKSSSKRTSPRFPLLPFPRSSTSLPFFHFQRYRMRSIKSCRKIQVLEPPSLSFFPSSLLLVLFSPSKDANYQGFRWTIVSSRVSLFSFSSLSLFPFFFFTAVNFLNEGTFGNIICLLFVRSQFNCRRTIAWP